MSTSRTEFFSEDGRPYWVEDPARDLREARQWAALVHMSGMAGCMAPVLGNLLGPWLVGQVQRDRHPLIDEAVRDALNFQIAWCVALVPAFLLSFALVGIPVLIGLFILNFGVTLVAGLRTLRGEDFDYPFEIEVLKS